MKINTFFLTVAAGVLLVLGALPLRAADDASKKVTITGSMVCGKCTLHETKSCQNVVQVKQDGKMVNYYLVQNDISTAAHDPVCGGDSEKVTVTGMLALVDGKQTLTPSKIDVVK